MKSLLVTVLLALLPTAGYAAGHGTGGAGQRAAVDSDSATATSSDSTKTVDFNETTHLVFMREEEKLARDVYTTLGIKYPALGIFGNISLSEESHTCAVCDTLTKYGIQDPVKSDNVGAFSGEDYGSYFTEKYQQLVARGSVSELEALYVGGFIEELDMLDINYCPDIVIKLQESITEKSDCGLVYTRNPDIQKLYNHLLDGSKEHLRAFVKLIEQRTGYGSYQPQLLTQEQLDEILGR